MTQLSILSHKQNLWLRKFAKQNSIKLDLRALSGILYLLRTGCQWRMIPPCYGKWKTLYQKFRSWSAGNWFSELQKRLISNINDLFAKTLVCTKSNHGTSEFIPYQGRWVVEHTFAWLDNFRRLSRNYEQHLHTAEAMAQLASIAILLNKL